MWNGAIPLTKEDFQAKRSTYGKDIPAYTSSAIYLYQKDDNGSLNFYVEALFFKSRSFMKEESPYTLGHEQLHFDITELYARILRKRIADTDFTKIRDVVGHVQKIYNKASAEWLKDEEKYDKETQHGINAAMQKKWAQDIAARLEELEAFASPAVSITE